MTFTDPSMLVALVALAIPAAIHLMGRRRARRVLLPTMRLAEGAHQSARGRTWLRHAALLAIRTAIVGLLVLALAGPRLTGGAGDEEGAAPSAGPPEKVSAPMSAARPIRILVVDAAEESGARVRSADLVAATFGADTASAKQVARAAAGGLAPAALASADAVFWVGSQAPPVGVSLVEFFARGSGLVWIPADARPPDAALAAMLGFEFGPAQAAAGAALDPAGYMSDLVEAFEGGTSGDLGAPVFRRRLVIASAAGDAIRFRDGPAAIADRRAGRGRVVALAFGPAPAWGDLAGRAEFVVLMHSLAEALAPLAQVPPVYSRGANYSRGAEYSRGAKYSRGAEYPPGDVDLTAWLILALALSLVAESLLSAGVPRPAPGI